MSRADQLRSALARANDRVMICRRNVESFLGQGSGEAYERTLRKLQRDLESAERNARWLEHQPKAPWHRRKDRSNGKRRRQITA
jgi:hypothetical protein